MFLDTHIQTSEGRLEFVNKWLEENPEPNEKELEWLANQLTYPLDKMERIRGGEITTDSRLVTIKKHETSYQSLSAKFEAGADAVEALSQSRSVTQERITRKIKPITQRELNEIPGLKQRFESAQFWAEKKKSSTGRAAWIAAKAFREDKAFCYEIRDNYYGVMQTTVPPSYTPYPEEYPVKEWIDPDGTIHYEGASLMKKNLCRELLHSQVRIKGKNWGKFNDMWFLLMDFERYMCEVLGDLPIFAAIVECKWSGLSNNSIIIEIEEEFGKKYTAEQISNIYCNKIPELIAERATDHFIDYWYTYEEKGTYKTCSCCGRTLIAHPRFFNRNSTSKDGFYSQCKTCRSKNRKKKKVQES